jgi:hypothetical protein
VRSTELSTGIDEAVRKQEYEEWMTLSDAILYIEATYGFRLSRAAGESLARKFSFLRKQTAIERRNGTCYVQLGPFVEMVEKGFFPDIPEGWKSSTYLTKKYNLLPVSLRTWIEKGKVKGMKILIGTTEVYFAKESEVRRYRDKRRDRSRSDAGRGRKQGYKTYHFNKRARRLLDI